MLRFLLWRLLGLLALVVGAALAVWLLKGGLGRLLRGQASSLHTSQGTVAILTKSLAADVRGVWGWAPVAGISPARAFAVISLTLTGCVALARWRARRGRRYVRLQIESHRTDHATPLAIFASGRTILT